MRLWPAGRTLLGAVLLLSVFLGIVVGPGATDAGHERPDEPPTPQSQTVPPSDESAREGTACPADASLSSDTDHNRQPPTERPAGPAIVELYPNPTTDGNVGEYAVLDVPNETAVGNWTLTDGHTTASFPNETVEGRVALTMDPEITADLTDDPVVELTGHLRLAADGDTLTLSDGNHTLDAVTYEHAPTADRWYRTNGQSESESEPGETVTPVNGSWWPRDATCLPPVTGTADEATTFVLPDSPDPALEAIDAADERILLGGYTFTDESVASALQNAAQRGVEVRVLLDSQPVGGTPAETASILEELAAAGVEVRALGGEGARYRFHHPKYAVADDTVVVTSENWKPAGIGGEASRGWGVALEDGDLASALETVFAADFAGWDTDSVTEYREQATFVEDDGSSETSFPSEYGPETVPIDSAELLVAPDNAEGRLRELLADAEDEILLKQASLGGTDLSLIEKVVDAARRGVDVRILLDSEWYVEDENQAVADELEEVASTEEIPIEVRLVEPDDRFEKIHAKSVVIDGETAVVGSANWNENAFENNREVLLVLHGQEAAAYYTAVFDGDWSEASRSLPIELGLGVAVTLAGAALVGHRYLQFGDEPVTEASHEHRCDTSREGADELDPIQPTDADARIETANASDTSIQTETVPEAAVRTLPTVETDERTAETAETNWLDSTSSSEATNETEE
ncbi:phospholipase D-like domain-containing protein [Halobacteria archaeon AArc-dxtr1]|nr:phospholipase D-like domain-containing protein [Halobacteria archaeon AArc-dxtr1]